MNSLRFAHKHSESPVCGSRRVSSSTYGNRGVGYLDLALGHAQGVGQPGSLGARQIFRLFESFFQGEDLLPGERGPRVLPFAVFVQ